MTRALLIFFAVMMAVYGYSLIASVGLTYHVERELDRRAEIVESHRALEDAYVAKLEDVRAAGNVLGLRMPERTRFIESFSSVAKADL
ncbi:MAG: hypothetical protein HYT22_02555 [Candidatus Niyogibacteria bacterium]|nr:hypothetical protein [Candidatus Niyogibacteria bacterium]